MKWYEESEGNVSTMRILALLAGITGIITVLAGVVAMFIGLGNSGIALSVGAGIITVALGGKALQKMSEVK